METSINIPIPFSIIRNIFNALNNLKVSDFDFKQYTYEEVVIGWQDECLFGRYK